ncbi:hypothetical protein [Fontivita pretiosa]|uniref:hypothetical protein n=1 Tax=Fontivita pretiosa TaxID=2989684 RepID=UPI003D17230E
MNHPDVDLTYVSNKYEMFAFGASSYVAPLGTVPATAFPGVFANDRDLRTLDPATKFTTAITGHSAQFVHAFCQVKGYWQTLLSDID